MTYPQIHWSVPLDDLHYQDAVLVTTTDGLVIRGKFRMYGKLLGAWHIKVMRDDGFMHDIAVESVTGIEKQ